MPIHLIGPLMLLGSLVMLAGGAAGAVAASRGGRPRLRNGFGAVVGSWLTVHVLLLVAWPVLAPMQVLRSGEDLAFCGGIDCHLHLAVLDARRAADLSVTIRLSSNAKREPEFPGLLRIRVVDAMGREYAPLEALGPDPLGAGESYTRELRFTVSGDAKGLQLVATWDGWLDRLVPGPENAWVKQRTRFELPSSAGGT